jgi:hypothetical protein
VDSVAETTPAHLLTFLIPHFPSHHPTCLLAPLRPSLNPQSNLAYCLYCVWHSLVVLASSIHVSCVARVALMLSPALFSRWTLDSMYIIALPDTCNRVFSLGYMHFSPFLRAFFLLAHCKLPNRGPNSGLRQETIQQMKGQPLRLDKPRMPASQPEHEG